MKVLDSIVGKKSLISLKTSIKDILFFDIITRYFLNLSSLFVI